MKKKEVEITQGKVVIRELNFGDENNATRKAVEQALLQGKNGIDIVTKREFLLLESIQEAPFSKNIENLRGLSRQDGLKLTAVFNELNEVVPGEQTTSEQASSKDDTQKESLEE